MNYLNLLEEAYELDEMSEARLPLLEEVIREADLLGILKLLLKLVGC